MRWFYCYSAALLNFGKATESVVRCGVPLGDAVETFLLETCVWWLAIFATVGLWRFAAGRFPYRLVRKAAP